MCTLNLLVLVGSLRAGSTNAQLADAAIAHLPAEVDGTIFTRLADLPHYSEDLDHDDTLPEVARDLREAVADADAVLLVSPEYNGSLPGVLKNAVDWVSRPRGAAAIVGKPAAVIGASGSPRGAVGPRGRGQGAQGRRRRSPSRTPWASAQPSRPSPTAGLRTTTWTPSSAPS